MTTPDRIRAAFSALAVAPDATLVVTVDPDLVTPEDIAALSVELERIVPGRWLVIAGAASVAAKPAATAAQEPQEAAERLPWHHWAPELRTRLKALAGRYPAADVAAVAAILSTGKRAGYKERRLVDELEGLGRRFAPASIAEAALELRRIIDEHGPRAEEHLAQLERQETRRR